MTVEGIYAEETIDNTGGSVPTVTFTRTSRARHGGAEGVRPGTESNLRSLTWNFKIILKNPT